LELLSLNSKISVSSCEKLASRDCKKLQIPEVCFDSVDIEVAEQMAFLGKNSNQRER